MGLIDGCGSCVFFLWVERLTMVDYRLGEKVIAPIL